MRLVLALVAVLGAVAAQQHEHHFIDVRKLVKGTIDAMASIPQPAATAAVKKNETQDPPEDLYRLFQLPADIMAQLAAEAGYIENVETTTYGPILKKASANSSPTFVGSFRQMTLEEEEREAQAKAEEKKAEEAKTAERKHHAPIILPANFVPAPASLPAIAPLPTLPGIAAGLGLPNLFAAHQPAPQAVNSMPAPNVLPTIPQGMSRPSYAYQPIVQPDGTTYYQQVMIVPSSIPFRPDQTQNKPVETTTAAVSTETTAPSTDVPTTAPAEPYPKTPKYDEKKVQKKFKTQGTKTMNAEEPLDVEDENKETENNSEKMNEKAATQMQENDDKKSEKESVKEESSKTAHKAELVTTILPSNEEQQRVAEVFAEEYVTHRPTKGLSMKRIESSSPLKINAIPNRELSPAGLLFRKNPMTAEGGQDDVVSPVEEEVIKKKHKKKHRKEIRRKQKSMEVTTPETPEEESSTVVIHLKKKHKKKRTKKVTTTAAPVFEEEEEEPATVSTTTTIEEPTTTTEEPVIETTTLRQMKKLSIRKRPAPEDDEPTTRPVVPYKRRIVAKVPEPLSEENSAFAQDEITQATSVDSDEEGTDASRYTTEQPTTTSVEPTTMKMKLKKVKKVRRKSKTTPTEAPPTTTTPGRVENPLSGEQVEEDKALITQPPQAYPAPIAFHRALSDLAEEEDDKKAIHAQSKKDKYAALQEKLEDANTKAEQAEEMESRVEMADEPVTTQAPELKKKKRRKMKKVVVEETENVKTTDEIVEPVADSKSVEYVTTESPEVLQESLKKHKKKLRKRIHGAKNKVLSEEITTTEAAPMTTEAKTEEPLVVSRHHCMNIRSFAFQFGMEDPTDFALMHCSFVENYYPHLTCERAEEYMARCRSYYRSD